MRFGSFELLATNMYVGDVDIFTNVLVNLISAFFSENVMKRCLMEIIFGEEMTFV